MTRQTRAWISTLSILIPALAAVAVGAEYSWQKPHAKVIGSGDLQWQPEPFVFEAGDQVRYIDYEAGDDDNAGTSKQQAWKHHSWDANAEGNAAADDGADTYVFKRGVVYRGRLVAKQSGEPGKPIRLTSHPEWGSGEASIFGSRRITGRWTRCDARSAPGIPDPEKVWYLDIDTEWTPRALWEIRNGDVIRIPIARDPNWTISNPNDPQAEWYTWTGHERGKGSIDTKNLTRSDPDYYEGGAVWTEWSGNMGTIHIAPIEKYDPQAHALSGRGINGRKGNRYYIENVRGLLDAPGEYFHAVSGPHAGRLYVRLPDDRDPNEAVLEASERTWLVEIRDQSHIVVSGLRFGFDDVGQAGTGWPPVYGAPAAVRIVGDCRDIRVSNCRFHHVAGAVVGFPRMNEKFSKIYMRDLLPWKADVLDEIAVTDNDIAYSDRQALWFSEGQMLTRVEWPPFGELQRLKILRNRLYHVGSRPGSNGNSAIPALAAIRPQVAEIAGNVIDRSWGAGLFTFSGKSGGDVRDVPLVRLLIHHNKVSNTMLACNDYGGLEAWQGGPIYIYNNISANAVGHKHYVDLKNDWKTVAYNVYLDGTFKSYLFNNIIVGRSNNRNDPYRNRGGYFVVLGFMNHFFNNTVYRFRHGIVGSSGNRSSYLGNVVANMSGSFIQQNRKGDTSLRGGGDTGEMGNRGVPTLAYGHNVFCGDASLGNVGRIRGSSLAELRKGLAEAEAQLSELGVHVEDIPLVDPADGDFRPEPGSAPVDRGVRFFVPWSLYAMAGEWNFRRNAANPEIALGEGFHMTEDWVDRHMYDLVPRNDLAVPGATAEDYVEGPLENWMPGALVFNGTDRYCVLRDADLRADIPYPQAIEPGEDRISKGRFTYPGRQRKTVDMGTNSFLIEIYFRAEAGRGGVLVSKGDGSAGYELAVTPEGRARLRLHSGDKQLGDLASTVGVADGQWHHVIAEVQRGDRPEARFYVDGKPAGSKPLADLPAGASLSNRGDFLVGKGRDGGFFTGAIDFLRISRGTLADAMTTIDELYAWQFDGPFLRDFTGRGAAGESRDAGAIEARP